MVSQPTNRQTRLRHGQRHIYFLVDVFRVVPIGYLRGGDLIAVGVHGGQDMDTRGVDDGLNPLIPQQVLGAHVLSQVYQQLSAQHLIPMHVSN